MRRPRDRKENSESIRSRAPDLRVCRARRAHVTSSRDVVSAGPIHPRRRLLRTGLLSNMPKLECNCSPEYKSASLPSKMHLPSEQASKTSAAYLPAASVLPCTPTYKTDRRTNSAAPQIKISNVLAQLCGCYLVHMAPRRSPTTSIQPPALLLCPASRLPLTFTRKECFNAHKVSIVEIHNCSKTHACEMCRVTYFSNLGQRAASPTSRATT